MMPMNNHIVYDNNATRYDIVVTELDNFHSDYYTQFCVAIVNFGECFFTSDLDFIAESIFKTKNTNLTVTDAINIQNAIAESRKYFGVDKLVFNYEKGIMHKA